MKTIITLLFLFITHFTIAQNNSIPKYEFSANTGVAIMTALPGNVDQQSSRKSGFGFTYNLPLGSRQSPLILSAGIEYNNVKYMADGYFARTAGKYSFSITPDNFKQHELRTHYIRVPLLAKFIPFRATTTGIGIYADYLLNAKSHYKIADNRFSIDAPIQNKFTAGLAFDEEIILLADKNKKSACIVGFGAYYQLTKNLKDGPSFKPFGAFVKVGVGLFP